MKKFKIEYFSESQQSLGSEERKAKNVEDLISTVNGQLRDGFSIVLDYLEIGNVIICSKVARFTVVAI